MAEATDVDVLIVGAGLSGIGAAVHLTKRRPKSTYAIVEKRSAIGGTWDLFRYPGIRSDSDMYTLGYSFKPWTEAKAIADGPSILKYVRETAAEYGVDKHIRFDHGVTSASWSSETARWTVTTEPGATFTCRYLLMCAGYYRYDAGHLPDWEGMADYGGTWVHPQHWPEGLDYAGKRVVVIGSGATAMTIVPVMAQIAAKVTMLQRSPTWVVTRPAEDALANGLRKRLPAMLAYQLIRWRNVLWQLYFYGKTRTDPQKVKELLLGQVKEHLGPDYDVATHFTPTYNPWDQRLCLVPDADLFEAIKAGKAEVVTDHIDRFTKDGVRLKSGQELPADIVVTATGLRMEIAGGVPITVDGAPVALNKALTYKGMMFSDVPNFASVFGYTNASWTLKADLTSEFVCRLLDHMDAKGVQIAVPRRDGEVKEEPWLSFTSGYVQRALDHLPKQGDRKPWKLNQNYALDMMVLRYSKLDDGVMEFARAHSVGAKAREKEAA